MTRALFLAALSLAPAATGCGRPAGPGGPDLTPAAPAAVAGVLKLSTGTQTLTGNFRESNDDAVAVVELPGATLCLAADGMGGPAVGGRDPGRLACDRAFEVLTRELTATLPAAATPDDTRLAVRRAVVAANEGVMAMGRDDPVFRNAGATVVLALWHHRQGLFVAGVGDSRVYLVGGGGVEQLTVDHSLARAMVEAGTITPAEAKTHRFRNVLWKYLGSKEVGDGPDVRAVPVRAGDRLLLCTDGVHGVVGDDRIHECVRGHADPQKCAEALCRLALDAGSRDNVSCVVMAFDEQ